MTASSIEDKMEIMDILKEQTRSHHESIQESALMKTLQEGSLPLVSYVSMLRALAVVHDVLERHLTKCTEKSIRSVWRDDMRKAPFLRQDLEFFRPRRLLDISEAAEKAVELTEKIRLCFAGSRIALLGYLYVLEGSTMGAPLVAEWLTETFEIQDGQGLSYFTNYGDLRNKKWEEFSCRMNSAVDNPEEYQSIVQAAKDAFDGLAEIFEVLYPVDQKQLQFTSTSLNPDAGRHPVPDNGVELEAALRASERCLELMPYFKYRYGDRGRNFSDSDSAWLTTLIEFDQSALNEQVEWLGRVLAGKGMPRIMLEKHLELLSEELCNARPEKSEQYSMLNVAAENLHTKRLVFLEDRDIEYLAHRFDEIAPNEWTERLPNTGMLLASAVADEADGLTNAVDSFVSWLGDLNIFPSEWVSAVDSITTDARERVKPKS